LASGLALRLLLDIPAASCLLHLAPGTIHATTSKGNSMNKLLFSAAIGLSLIAPAAFAEPVHDWHDIEAVHTHIVQALHEMKRIHDDNRYDTDGHAINAEKYLEKAEAELHLAVDSAKKAK
jgi:hypothetical protein